MRIPQIIALLCGLTAVGCGSDSESSSPARESRSAAVATDPTPDADPASPETTSEPAEATSRAPVTVAAPPRAPVDPKLLGRVENLVSHARRLFGRRKNSSALYSLDKAIELLDTHVGAIALKSEILHAQRRFRPSLELLESALTRVPGDVTLLYRLGTTLDALDRPAEALAALEKIFSTGAAAPDARFLRTLVLARGRNKEKTIASLEDAVEHGFRSLHDLEKALNGRLAFVASDERVQRILKMLEEEEAERLAASETPRELPEYVEPPKDLSDWKDWLEGSADTSDGKTASSRERTRARRQYSGAFRSGEPASGRYKSEAETEYYSGTTGPKMSDTLRAVYGRDSLSATGSLATPPPPLSPKQIRQRKALQRGLTGQSMSASVGSSPILRPGRSNAGAGAGPATQSGSAPRLGSTDETGSVGTDD